MTNHKQTGSIVSRLLKKLQPNNKKTNNSGSKVGNELNRLFVLGNLPINYSISFMNTSPTTLLGSSGKTNQDSLSLAAVYGNR